MASGADLGSGSKSDHENARKVKRDGDGHHQKIRKRKMQCVMLLHANENLS